MSSFTCISCHVAFGDAEAQRGHYKSDWHRYNLKRKVVGMPPVSSTVFQDKVKVHRINAINKETESISGFFCKLCQKKFSSHNAFENHKKSKKHRDFVSKSIAKVISQNEEKDDSDIIQETKSSLNKAIADAKADFEEPKILRPEEKSGGREFASGDNPRLQWFKKQEKAMIEQEEEEMWEDVDDDEFDEEEMSEDEQVKDEDADLESLSSDVSGRANQRQIATTECLFCLKKSNDIEANVVHMSQKHGFFLPDLDYLNDLEGLLHYLGEKVGIGNVCLWCNEKGKAFYSLSAVLKHMRDKGHCHMLVTGDAALEYADFYDFGDEIMDEEEQEEETDVGDVDGQDLELVLPSGATIGHRNLLKYYKQNFPTVQRQTSSKQKSLARLVSQYKAIGWHGSTTSQISRAQKDLAYVKSLKSKYMLKLAKNNNKTQMKHFRCQVIF